MKHKEKAHPTGWIWIRRLNPTSLSDVNKNTLDRPPLATQHDNATDSSTRQMLCVAETLYQHPSIACKSSFISYLAATETKQITDRPLNARNLYCKPPSCLVASRAHEVNHHGLQVVRPCTCPSITASRGITQSHTLPRIDRRASNAHPVLVHCSCSLSKLVSHDTGTKRGCMRPPSATPKLPASHPFLIPTSV